MHRQQCSQHPRNSARLPGQEPAWREMVENEPSGASPEKAAVHFWSLSANLHLPGSWAWLKWGLPQVEPFFGSPVTSGIGKGMESWAPNRLLPANAGFRGSPPRTLQIKASDKAGPTRAMNLPGSPKPWMQACAGAWRAAWRGAVRAL